MRTNAPYFEPGTLNAYHIRPEEIKSGDRYGYKVVAVVYANNFWMAYRGPTGWDDERVANEGDQVEYSVARRLFPTLDAVGHYSD